MNEIPASKKLEVAECFLKGDTYKEIEEQTGVSHGSIVNIIKELDTHKLNIPGIQSDQINDLRHLALDLKKKGLATSQALLGLLLFVRCHNLGIGMERLDQWAGLVNKVAGSGFPKDDFCQAALRLHQLEATSGKPFEILTEEYKKTKEHLDHLSTQVDSLAAKKEQLLKEIKPLSIQMDALTKQNGNLESQRKILLKQVDQLKSDVAEREKERSGLAKEIKELKQTKTQLSAEVDGKEVSLVRLKAIGFLDEDFIRLRTILESVASDNHADDKEIKEKFFTTLGSFKDLTALDKIRDDMTKDVQQLDERKCHLEGEIQELENRRAVLQGEIGQSAASVTEQIIGNGRAAASELKSMVEDIRSSFNLLITDAMKTAGVISDMKAETKKGEESAKSLNEFITEVKAGLGRN